MKGDLKVLINNLTQLDMGFGSVSVLNDYSLARSIPILGENEIWMEGKVANRSHHAKH